MAEFTSELQTKLSKSLGLVASFDLGSNPYNIQGMLIDVGTYSLTIMGPNFSPTIIPIEKILKFSIIPVAYVLNAIENTLVPIQLSPCNCILNLPIPTNATNPVDLAIISSPRGPRAYVVDSTGKRLVSIDLLFQSTFGQYISFPTEPQFVVSSPQNNFIYTVTNTGMLYVINTTTNAIVKNIQLSGTPTTLSINRSGSQLFVGCSLTENCIIYVISTSTYTVTGSMYVIDYPKGIITNLEDNLIYVTVSSHNRVYIFNLITNSFITAILVGTSPSGIASTTNGYLAYVCNSGSNTVSMINLANNTVNPTPITVQANPTRVIVAGNNFSAYSVNTDANSLTAMYIFDNAKLNIPVGSRPVAIAQVPFPK